MTVDDKAWGSVLEPDVNQSINVTSVSVGKRGFLPHTLRDAVAKETPVYSTLMFTKDTMKQDLLDLKTQAQESYHRFLTLSTTNNSQGLALNHFAVMIDTINTLLKKYE
jgi:hypothetical protein